MPSLKTFSVKILGFITVTMLALGLNVSPAAAAETSKTINGVIYTMDRAGAAYASGFTSDLPTTVSIESSVTIGGSSYSVTKIGRFAFSYNTALTAVTIPASVKTIGDYAFFSDEALRSVTFKGAAPSAGRYIFYGSWAHVYFFKRFGADAVAGGFTSTWQGLTASAVDNAPVESITINNVIYTMDGVGAAYVSNFEGRRGQKYLPTLSIISIEPSVTIGGESYAVTKIGDDAFQGSIWLTSVTVPDSVKIIATDAFMYCESLVSVNLGGSVESIGKNAFYGDTSLVSVTIPDSVKVIGDQAFNNDKIGRAHV